MVVILPAPFAQEPKHPTLGHRQIKPIDRYLTPATKAPVLLAQPDNLDHVHQHQTPSGSDRSSSASRPPRPCDLGTRPGQHMLASAPHHGCAGRHSRWVPFVTYPLCPNGAG